MAAYRRVYDSRHVQADFQEPGSVPEPYTLDNRVWAAFFYGHTMRKQGSCLDKEIMQGTMSGARRRKRPRAAWMDNIKT